MGNFFKGYSRKRIIFIISLFILAVSVVILICTFTSQNGTVSNETSKVVAKIIENFVANFFAINHEALFWRETLNLIVRRAAHIIEYMMLGIFVCALVNLVLNKPGYIRSAIITFSGCTVLAMTDVFRQQFVPGRHTSLSDLRLDMFGAALGITLTTVIFVVVLKMYHQKVESRFKSSSKQV